MRRFFITSCGTGIGKTLVTAALCHQLHANGQKVTAVKPVISGFEMNDMFSDSAQLLASMGREVSSAEISDISPWRYKAPLAPSMAARLENRQLDFSELIEFCRNYTVPRHGMLLVEGVGGVMAPITDRHTVLDWMETLGWPVITVCGSYLGSISHALTAVAAVESRGLMLQALIVSESSESGPALADTAYEIEKFLRKQVPVVQLPRITGKPAWQAAPPLTGILD